MACPSSSSLSIDFARERDRNDPLRHLRNEFLIPTKADLKRKHLTEDEDAHGSSSGHTSDEESTYLCGNSLGLQPKRTKSYIDSYLQTWRSLGVFGHFKPMANQKTVPWLDIGDQAAELACRIVGALPTEVAVMQTLTANLHLLMASFYRPNRDRWKIIIEGKAFPSDHYAVLSQVRHHGLSIEDTFVMIEPDDKERHIFSTDHILRTIEEHAKTTALILLPGVHFYSGQYMDISAITSYAQERGILVGWDLAHAVGNVPLKLHDWNVDFAAWCSYKYLNSGPGSIAGLFVHERHGKISRAADGTLDFTPRLSGWWGSDKDSRFKMENQFVPIPGAAGWQLSNPSAFDCTSVIASLSIFSETSMAALRDKSLGLTAYLERLLTEWPLPDRLRRFSILTPSDSSQRGAQLSVRLQDGLLDQVMKTLEEEGVVVDERRPDVVRVAPAPLYNSFEDCFRFMVAFEKALKAAVDFKESSHGSNGDVVV